jgi:hypothetical protein
VPIYVWLSSEQGIEALLDKPNRPQKNDSATHNIFAFGDQSHCCNREQIEHPLRAQEELAQAIHKQYREDFMSMEANRGKPPPPTWEDADETFREASRAAADHVIVKLYDVGRCIGEGLTSADAKPLAPEEVTLLAEVEHNRWLVDRLTDGWRYGPRRDNAKKERPQICANRDLPDDQHMLDVGQIQALPKILQRINAHIRCCEGALNSLPPGGLGLLGFGDQPSSQPRPDPRTPPAAATADSGTTHA